MQKHQPQQAQQQQQQEQEQEQEQDQDQEQEQEHVTVRTLMVKSLTPLESFILPHFGQDKVKERGCIGSPPPLSPAPVDPCVS